ncbi:MAG: hypothetical protein K8T25_23640 [Planctomycetia bacterium]|nr:hypothetical protein [Planctomycetia bacterium]
MKINPVVDRLPRHEAPGLTGNIQPRSASDLIRRPTLLQMLANILMRFRIVQLARPATSLATGFRQPLGLRLKVASVRSRDIQTTQRYFYQHQSSNLSHLKFDITNQSKGAGNEKCG